MKMATKKLTKKEKLFVKEYIALNFNGTEAVKKPDIVGIRQAESPINYFRKLQLKMQSAKKSKNGRFAVISRPIWSSGNWRRWPSLT
jgi:hypothetical protein